jgi:large subunit ribosomal protein L2
MLFLKKLTEYKKNNSGRNNQGRITVRHRGGSQPLRYVLVDFKRALFDVPAVVLKVHKDFNRNAFIALLLYKNGILSYIIAPDTLKRGDSILSSEKTFRSPGNAMLLQNMVLGSIIHNVELHYGKGSQLCRAAGTYATLVAKKVFNNLRYGIVRLKSKEEYFIFLKNFAVFGVVSNIDAHLIKLKNAGASRRLGIRPHVRGVAMNPIDHPHGGGEGKTSGGRPSVTPWGKLTKGQPTRKPKKKSFIFFSRKLN